MLPKNLKIERPREKNDFDDYYENEHSDSEKTVVEENLRRESTVSRKQSMKDPA